MIRCHKNVFLTLIYMKYDQKKFCPNFAASISQSRMEENPNMYIQVILRIFSQNKLH